MTRAGVSAAERIRIHRRRTTSGQACWLPALLLVMALALATPCSVAARRYSGKTNSGKKPSVRRPAGMRAAGEAGQAFIDVMTGRRPPVAGESPEKLLDAAVAAYTEAANDPTANHTEAWNQIGYLQKGYYQEQKKKGLPVGKFRQHRERAFAAYRNLVTEINPNCVKGWEGLAEVHNDMAEAGEADMADAVETYRAAVAAHPTWVRGARRAAEIVLTEHGVADTEGGRWSDTDALEVMDQLVDLVATETKHFRRICGQGPSGRQTQW